MCKYVLCGLQEAFDSIYHDKLLVTMMDMGYPLHLIDLLAKLYRKQIAKVKVAGALLEWFRVKKGVRQGHVLSPYLFNILEEMVMRETSMDSKMDYKLEDGWLRSFATLMTSCCWPIQLQKTVNVRRNSVPKGWRSRHHCRK